MKSLRTALLCAPLAAAVALSAATSVAAKDVGHELEATAEGWWYNDVDQQTGGYFVYVAATVERGQGWFFFSGRRDATLDGRFENDQVHGGTAWVGALRIHIGGDEIRLRVPQFENPNSSYLLGDVEVEAEIVGGTGTFEDASGSLSLRARFLEEYGPSGPIVHFDEIAGTVHVRRP